MAAMPDSVRGLLATAVCGAAFLLPPIMSMYEGRALWVAWVVVAIAVSAGTLYAIRRPDEVRQRRKAKGHCAGCDYDLAGNVSGVCPECGGGVIHE